jgi:hypothetical protein
MNMNMNVNMDSERISDNQQQKHSFKKTKQSFKHQDTCVQKVCLFQL